MKTPISSCEPARECNDCLCLLARQASRAITDLYDLVLSPTKMRATQFILLKILAAEGAVSQKRLGMVLAVAPETMSRRLSALRSAGLISLCAGSRGRQRVYALTDAGKTRLKVAGPYWRRSRNRMRTCMSREQWAATHSACGCWQAQRAMRNRHVFRIADKN
jgi:DNA-binding MarR family transcriptional regulator